MQLRRLNALVQVVEKGSFSAAAAELGLSQPAVSQQIRALEESLGVPLLDRQASGPVLTEAGRIAYRRGQQMLALWAELERDVAGLREELRGRLLIGASSVPATYFLPRLLGVFCERHRQVECAVEVEDSQEVLRRVAGRQVDLALVGDEPRDRRLVSRPIAEDRIVLIAPVGHPFRGDPPLPAAILARERFVMRERGSGTRAAAEERLAACGIRTSELRCAVELSSTEAVIAAVEAGLGVSFVSLFASRPAVRAGRVIELPVECAPITRRIHLVYHRARIEEPLIRSFLDYLQGCLDASGMLPHPLEGPAPAGPAKG